MTDVLPAIARLCLPAVAANVQWQARTLESYELPTFRWMERAARVGAGRYDGVQNTAAAAVIKRVVANWFRRHPTSPWLLDDPCDDGAWL